MYAIVFTSAVIRELERSTHAARRPAPEPACLPPPAKPSARRPARVGRWLEELFAPAAGAALRVLGAH